MKNEKLKKYIPLISVALIFLLIGAATAAYIIRFYYEKPATISVISNYYQVSVYEDSGLTTEITSVDFPSILFDDLGGETSTTDTLYLHADGAQAGKPISCLWNSTCGDLYTDITLTAEWYDTDHWAAWVEDTGVITLTEAAPTLQIRFTIDGVDAYINNYSFDIGILANSES